MVVVSRGQQSKRFSKYFRGNSRFISGNIKFCSKIAKKAKSMFEFN